MDAFSPPNWDDGDGCSTDGERAYLQHLDNLPWSPTLLDWHEISPRQQAFWETRGIPEMGREEMIEYNRVEAHRRHKEAEEKAKMDREETVVKRSRGQKGGGEKKQGGENAKENVEAKVDLQDLEYGESAAAQSKQRRKSRQTVQQATPPTIIGPGNGKPYLQPVEHPKPICDRCVHDHRIDLCPNWSIGMAKYEEYLRQKAALEASQTPIAETRSTSGETPVLATFSEESVSWYEDQVSMQRGPKVARKSLYSVEKSPKPGLLPAFGDSAAAGPVAGSNAQLGSGSTTQVQSYQSPYTINSAPSNSAPSTSSMASTSISASETLPPPPRRGNMQPFHHAIIGPGPGPAATTIRNTIHNTNTNTNMPSSSRPLGKTVLSSLISNRTPVPSQPVAITAMTTNHNTNHSTNSTPNSRPQTTTPSTRTPLPSQPIPTTARPQTFQFHTTLVPSPAPAPPPVGVPRAPSTSMQSYYQTIDRNRLNDPGCAHCLALGVECHGDAPCGRCRSKGRNLEGCRDGVERGRVRGLGGGGKEGKHGKRGGAGAGDGVLSRVVGGEGVM